MLDLRKDNNITHNKNIKGKKTSIITRDVTNRDSNTAGRIVNIGVLLKTTMLGKFPNVLYFL